MPDYSVEQELVQGGLTDLPRTPSLDRKWHLSGNATYLELAA